MMRRNFRVLLGIFAALVWAASALAADVGVPPSVTFVIPPDGAVVHGADALVLFWTPPQFKPTIMRDGLVEKPTKVIPGDTADLHHIRVSLNEGKNVFSWTDPATDKKVGELTLYFAPPGSGKRLPKAADCADFKFHRREFEDKCDECHSIPEEMETVRGRPMSPAGKVCSSCHPEIEKASKLHEPSATYDCFRCHETAYKPSRFCIASSQSGLCGLCHPNFTQRLLGSAKFLHGPVGTGSCLICHDPHGGNAKGLVREKSEVLCMRCHADTVALGVKDSLHGDVSCTDCHEPHGADNPQLTRAKGALLCARCHNDVTKDRGGHPIGGHPVAADNDPSKPGRPMNCLSCHTPHGVADVSQQNIFADDNERKQRNFCFRCHY